MAAWRVTTSAEKEAQVSIQFFARFFCARLPLMVLPLLVGCGPSAARSVLPAQSPVVAEYDSGSCSVSRKAVISSVARQIRSLSSIKLGQREKSYDPGIKTGKGMSAIEGMEIEEVENGVKVTYFSGRRNLNTGTVSMTKSVGIFKVKLGADGKKATISVTPPETLEHEIAKNKYLMDIDPLLDDAEAAKEFARIGQALQINAC